MKTIIYDFSQDKEFKALASQGYICAYYRLDNTDHSDGCKYEQFAAYNKENFNEWLARFSPKNLLVKIDQRIHRDLIFDMEYTWERNRFGGISLMRDGKEIAIQG